MWKRPNRLLMALLLRILRWLVPLSEIGYVSALGNPKFPPPTSLEGKE